MSNGANILLTRPRAQSEELARELGRTDGLDAKILISPLMAIEPVSSPPSLDPFDAAIFTSENGVREFSKLHDPGGKIAYCVGPRTARVASEAGFKAVNAGGTAENLLAAMPAPTRARGRLLWVCGVHKAFDLAPCLASRGFEIQEACLYMQAERALSEEAMQLLRSGERVILPLFSRRSADLFLKAASGMDLSSVDAVLIRGTLAAGLPPGGFGSIAVSKRPDGESMLPEIQKAARKAMST